MGGMSSPARTVDNVPRNLLLPGPCHLCGGVHAQRTSGVLACAVCAWRYGDVPDADLPLPLIDVVYYLRFDQRVKIGTSRRPRQRLARIRHDELLAFERGDRTVEQRRHREFAPIREGGEWFTFTTELEAHVKGLRQVGDPWQLYARWLSGALRAGTVIE